MISNEFSSKKSDQATVPMPSGRIIKPVRKRAKLCNKTRKIVAFSFDEELETKARKADISVEY